MGYVGFRVSQKLGLPFGVPYEGDGVYIGVALLWEATPSCLHMKTCCCLLTKPVMVLQIAMSGRDEIRACGTLGRTRRHDCHNGRLRRTSTGSTVKAPWPCVVQQHFRTADHRMEDTA